MAYYRKNFTKSPALNFEADAVWAASAAATRVNGRYVKAGEAVDETVKTNRELMLEFLADSSKVTDADRELGNKVRGYYKGLMFKILQGKTLGEFENSAMAVANRDTITATQEVGIIASLPECYNRAVKRDETNRRIENATGGLIGREGDKVSLTVEVVKYNFSQMYGVYFISALTSDDQAVFFSYKHAIDFGKVIKIQGTVKGYRDNLTQLNRVKVVA